VESFGETQRISRQLMASKQELSQRARIERDSIYQALATSKKLAPGQKWYLVDAKW
jgi:hypothetical protein